MTVNRLDGSRPVPHPDEPAPRAAAETALEAGTGAAPTGDTSNVVDVLRRIGELVGTLRADTPGGGVAARVVRSGGGGSPTDQTVEVMHDDGSVNGWVIPGTPSVEK